jgi:cell division transport system permease protein
MSERTVSDGTVSDRDLASVSLRPRNADDLGLRRALSDRLLPLLVAAMAFLAVLALAGAVGAHGLASHWRADSSALLTVQVPRPDAAGEAGAAGYTRAEAVARMLSGEPGVQSARRLTGAEVGGLLAPWLGHDTEAFAIALPAVFEVHAATASVATGLSARLQTVAAGTLVEANGVWFERLGALAGSLQTCAALALALVTFVAIAVVAVATRAGLAARRDAIEIVHGLGATDGMIARRFSARLTLLTFAGAAAGVLAAVPMLLVIAGLTAPFGAAPADEAALAGRLPPMLWAALPMLPLAAAGIGWMTAQVTVRSWLSVLP